MHSKADLELIARLNTLLLTEASHALGGATECDLVEYPAHTNIGDSALWLGERATLRTLGITVRATLVMPFYQKTRLHADGPLVILPGGNFGGLYQGQHDLKLTVLNDFPGRPVVQFPQSLHYASDLHRDQLRRAVSRHGATTLMFRDRRSFEVGQRDFDCEVRLSPDSAFSLGPLKAPRSRAALAIHARTDFESAGTIPVRGVAPFDWLVPRHGDLVVPLRRLYGWGALAESKINSPSARGGSLLLGDLFAKSNLRRGAKLLSSGEHLVTDRLHGHILASLLGVSHTVVGDKFGKVRAMWDTWTHEFECAEFCPTWEDVDAFLPEAV